MSARFLLSVVVIAGVSSWPSAFAASAPAIQIGGPSAPVNDLPLRGGKSWSVPKCSKVTGTSYVTFTLDDGQSLAATQGSIRITGYTYGLVALSSPNTLLGAFNRTLIRSTSAGCKWDAIAQIPTVSDGSPVILVASVGDRAYGFSDARPDLVRVDGTDVIVLKSPVDSIVGLAADPSDPSRARLGGGDGTIWDTRDAGATWTRIGGLPGGDSTIVYRIAFDPADLDHAIVGVAQSGAFVTFDGGGSFLRASGLSSVGKGSVNVFNGVFSRTGSGVAWVMGLDLAEADSGAPSQGRHIYRSTDGGLTFAPVVDSSADVVLPNGPTMAAKPGSDEVLYFTFGTSSNAYGTDVYKYDQAAGLVTKTHNDYDRMPAIEFNPADPSVIYLGLAAEIGF